ncbi:MAG: molecular chaperone HtpG [Candidatus Rariloculaceae bacterium]
MADSDQQATFSFQTEVKQLMHLMVHSLYSNKEIFLRELISNASDANDKLRFEAIAEPALLEEQPDLRISVGLDPENQTISISDNGIGMSRDDIVEQLGTIAHSGTSEFLGRLSGDAKQDSQLIGQFGVGFYSAFIVAEEVEVSSRRAGAPASEGVKWTSTGEGEFTVEDIDRPERGTSVKLKLKPDETDFLQTPVVTALIQKYSDHIAFPVDMQGESDESDEPETVNRAKALWTRPRTEIEDEEYVEFYKHIAHDFVDPLVWSHNRVEGKREYTSLLYVPATAPFDLWNRESPRGVKLYVQRVFISDEATQFLPLYLRFIRGVVDSNDLSLNISRELLQKDPNVAAIKSALTKRMLDLLERLARDDTEKYREFWNAFGTVLKEGVVEDPGNREKIASLLRFDSTKSDAEESDRSLADYLESASDDQEFIYFLTAESPAAARSSPHLESLREKGIEVLLLSERIDEWVMQHLTEYDGKKFRDVSRGELDLKSDDDEKLAEPDLTKEQQSFLKRMKRALRERVNEVRLSDRLRESAACLVVGEHELGFQMRELLKAAGQDAPDDAPSLELNFEHPLIQRLEREADDETFESLSVVILEQARLVEGQSLDDPAGFVHRMNDLLLGTESTPG